MSARQYLSGTILLGDSSDGELFKRTFVIEKVLSEGASVVCYEAYHKKSGRGVLKEFYPQENFLLERDEEGQLICSTAFPDFAARFHSAESEYLEPYQMLLEAKKDSNLQNLGTFIPPFEIYRGCSKSGELVGTTYVWTPEPKLETFDKVCEEIHEHPMDSPEHKLVTALLAIDSLAKCVCDLHKADMIHRDIKPSNFGFDRRGSQTLTQTLTMFDINSICSVFGNISNTIGSEGYLEPEAGYELPTNQTDIYSIGATLFHAIVVTDETKLNQYTYKKEYYERLDELVRDSELITASEANSHPRLRSILVQILKNCLCERTYRYPDCEALLKDLNVALYYALPSEIAQQDLMSEKWVLSAEKSLDVNKEKNSFLAIQYHLYSHPLYRYCTDADSSMNVLVLGFGNYGQKFLDACLQNGQVRNKQLHVTVISGDASDKDIYLTDRPELPNFFNVDGSLDGRSDAYGDIIFQTSELFRDVPETDEASFQSIVSEYCKTRHPHYVFIALGSDPLNKKAAESCSAICKEMQMNCIVSYVSERTRAAASKTTDVHPIYVNVNLKDSDLYVEVERMAFNTNLVWEKDLNVEFSSIRAHFKKPYNHDASVSNVLALASKLYSIGIDLQTTSFGDAARQFNEIMASSSGKAIKNELIWIEHRRWVTEKICLGWRPIKNLSDCSNGVTRDEKQKRHICILRSRPDQMLADSQRSGRFRMWDDAPTSELDQLDDLDRLSVDMHRMFKRNADEARKQDLLSGSTMDSIRSLIEGNRAAIVAYQEWLSCLKGIWHNDTNQVPLYQGSYDSFLAATDSLSAEKQSVLNELMRAFDTTFYPVRASMEYRDWKKDDAELIHNIPFILTYTEEAYLVVPFATGDSKDIFTNVAAATVVNPERILYLYLLDHDHTLDQLRVSLPSVLEYMRKKHFRAMVDLVLLAEKAAEPAQFSDAQRDLLDIGDGRIRLINPIISENRKSLMRDLVSYLKQRSAGKRFFALERNATGLSYLLEGAEVFDSFDSYYFHSNTMTFSTSAPNCDMLNHITKSPYITVSDMAAFHLSSSESSNQPEFFNDYKELWKRYRENKDVWKNLCITLGNYAQAHDVLATFKKLFINQRNSVPADYYYIVPSACNRAVSKIIRFLVQNNFLEEGSRVISLSSDSCEVRIHDCCGYRETLDKLFSNIYCLLSPDDIALHFNPKTHEAVVSFDNLVVSGVQLPGKQLSDYIGLMNFFKEKSYVTNLVISQDGRTNFTYGSRQIKSLLTVAGKMLEVHTYHKTKELGWFDDIVSSYELNWEGEDVKNEFDCILTKGFRTLFVECKARIDIEQDFYFKISSLSEKFGINATAVLIADTQEKSNWDSAPIDALQRKRGQMMDVVTIWKPEEINNIGHTLVKVMKGNYMNGVD